MRDRLPTSIRGRYVRTDGQVVAENVDDLFSGMLLAPIELDEHGEVVWGYGAVTGTQPDGTAAPGTHCDNWTGNSLLDESLYEGNPSAINGEWTMDLMAGSRRIEGVAGLACTPSDECSA